MRPQFRTDLIGAGFRPMPEMAEYAASSGAACDFADGMHNTQPGDPYKAARAIELAVDADVTHFVCNLVPMRSVPSAPMQKKLIADMATWENLARDTVFDREAA